MKERKPSGETAASDPPARAEVRTAEAWAEAKGLYPEFREVHAPFSRADATPIREHNPQFWRFAGAKAGCGWPVGKELTEAEFDAAIEATVGNSGHKYR